MPRKKIDHRIIEQLAGIGCTMEEMAAVKGIHRATFFRDVAKSEKLGEALSRGREKMKVSIRRMQMKRAEDGDTGMQIWLGKQYLGQRDYSRMEAITATLPASGGSSAAKIVVEYVNQIDAGYQIEAPAAAPGADSDNP